MVDLTSPPGPEDTLVELALKVLHVADPWEKANVSDAAVKLWRSGEVRAIYREGVTHPVPDKPARSDKVRLLAPGAMPRRGKGGSLESRRSIVHSLCHIESWAVDLSWDIIARFAQPGASAGAGPEGYGMPREFFDDFVTVADDECRHFRLLAARLEAMGSHYGAMPAHDGLWESAERTAGSLPARLAVEHCAHEARGLDVLPQTIARMRRGGDEDTAALLEGTVYPEEITHCAAGVRWLKHLHARAGEADGAWALEARKHENVAGFFHALMTGNFGSLKPPFNHAARAEAGFDPTWYLPLARAQGSAAAAPEAGASVAGAPQGGEAQAAGV
ncbi:unnamed protein product [Pedinophyceae sp. YPF-701]|nr:unnamed protein product [Pedinophyceae sp. YPF-701]